MKKLLFVTLSPIDPVNGSIQEKLIFSFIKELELKGWNLEIVCAQAPSVQGSSAVENAVSNDKVSQSLCSRSKPKIPDFRKLIEAKLKNFNPDVVLGVDTQADVDYQFHLLDWIAGLGYPVFCFLQLTPDSFKSLPNTVVAINALPDLTKTIALFDEIAQKYISSGQAGARKLPTEFITASNPLVSIVVVPRQQFGILEECLERICRFTDVPFELIVVGCGTAKPEVLASNRYPHLKVVWSESYLYPYQTKNLSLEHISDKTKWVVFIDNDVRVHPKWLSKMVQAAEEEKAGAAHPLYLFEKRYKSTVHTADGVFKDNFYKTGGPKPVMNLFDEPVSSTYGLKRKSSDFVEFHCWLIRKDVLKKIGVFDPVTVGEHIHHSLQLRELNEKIVFEPESVVNYVAVVDHDSKNRNYLQFRWDHNVACKSVEFLCKRWPQFKTHWESKIELALHLRHSNEPWYSPRAIGKKIRDKWDWITNKKKESLIPREKAKV